MDETIIKVQFHTPVNGRCEYYFGSFAAIYEKFTPEQIGCALRTLWVSDLPKATRQCVITRHSVIRKPQANPKNEIR